VPPPKKSKSMGNADAASEKSEPPGTRESKEPSTGETGKPTPNADAANEKHEPKGTVEGKEPRAEEAHYRIDELTQAHNNHASALEALPHALLAIFGTEVDKRIATAMDKYKREDKADDMKDKAEDRKMFIEICKSMKP